MGWAPALRSGGGDVVIAKALARLLILVVIYVSAYTLLRDYAFA